MQRGEDLPQAGPLSSQPTGSYYAAESHYERDISMPETYLDTPPKSEHDVQCRKVHRLGRACDPCSARKTKCDQSKPCGPCRSLDIPCTFDRPKRRRGPPNRLAEAIKRDHDASLHRTQTPSDESSQNQNLQHFALSESAEMIGPIELVGLLLDDYFTFLHPLQPFPHETQFRTDFRLRRDQRDPYFLALLASMVGALVAAYPRRPRQRLKKLKREDLFSNAGEFVRRCHRVATQARGPAYIEKEHLDASDAATSYCLMTICACTYRMTQANLYCGEAYNVIRSLLARLDDPNQERNRVEEEMTKRLFWTVFTSVRSSIAFGATPAVPVNPPSSNHKYPPLPLELDDELILPYHVGSQPPELPSRIAGFCASVRLCLTYDPLVALDSTYNGTLVSATQDQRTVLWDSMRDLKRLMSQLPGTLTTWQGPPSSNSPSAATPCSTSSVHSPLAGSVRNPEDRLEAANGIQKANIGVTYLSARSYFAERYFNLLERHESISSDTAQARDWIRGERESIASDLLHCLDSIMPIHLEPNGATLCFKIRQITSTLLPDSTQTHESSSVDSAKLASEGRLARYLSQFVYILSALERGLNGPMTSPAAAMVQEEEEDLRNWASLRDHQREYAKTGRSAGG